MTAFRDSGLPDSLKVGTRDFKAKSGRDSFLKICTGDGMPKNNPRDYGIRGFVGRDYEIEAWRTLSGTQRFHILNYWHCSIKSHFPWIELGPVLEAGPGRGVTGGGGGGSVA